MKSIVLGGGCFWCTEAVFQQVRGVEKVVSGYAGGTSPEPTYHNPGDHAEVIKVSYDENRISLPEILEIFFGTHDPTSLNFQGNDYGAQYRGIILCAKDELETAAQAKAEAQKLWDEPVVTDIGVLEKFYPAESYHQNYFRNNPTAAYCQVVINPKLDKFRKSFKDYLA